MDPKAPTPTRLPALRLLVVGDDPQATLTRIRLREPLAPLAAAWGWTLDWARVGDARWQDLRRWDLLLVQRGASPKALQLMQRMQSTGGRVLYDIDDLLTEPAPHLHHHHQLLDNRDWVHRCLRQADRVVASTSALQAALRSLPGMARKPVSLAPNAALEVEARAPRRDDAAPTRVILAASDNLAVPWLAPALARAQALRPGRLRVIAIGAASPALAGSGVAFETRPLLAREDYWRFLADGVNTLLLAPLDSSRFSSCKSACKFLDAASVGVPVVASRRAPYDEVMLHGRTGWLVADETEAWMEVLLRAVDQPTALQSIADQARDDALLRFSLADTSRRWSEALLAERRHVATRRRAPWGERLRLLAHRVQQANRQRLVKRRQRQDDAGASVLSA